MSKIEKIKFTSDYICRECALKYAEPRDGVTTVHISICGLCGESRSVTHQRNWGWFLSDKEKFEFVGKDKPNE